MLLSYHITTRCHNTEHFDLSMSVCSGFVINMQDKIIIQKELTNLSKTWQTYNIWEQQ